MTSMNIAYVNALLADAAYVSIVDGAPSEAELKDRLTETQANYLAANFTVKATTDPASEGFNAVVWEGKPGTEFAGQVFVSMRGTQEVQDFVDDA